MRRFWTGLTIALLALFTLSPVVYAHGFRGGDHDDDDGGRVFIGGGFGRFGGFYGPGWGWGDGWWGPGWGWGWNWPTYYPSSHEGHVKINAEQKGLPIYVDGGYVGVTGKIKKFPLRPGNHTIEIRNLQGQTILQQKVHVIAGKTIDLYAG